MSKRSTTRVCETLRTQLVKVRPAYQPQRSLACTLSLKDES